MGLLRGPGRLGILVVLGCSTANAGPDHFRIPAPREDQAPQVHVPVFGKAAGHAGTDRTLRVTEWVAKRTWHVLGLPYTRTDFIGPPPLKTRSEGGWLVVEGTVADGGVPLRNQVVTCQIEQIDKPVLILLRSTDAFGEVLMELDLRRGSAQARSVTVSRSMVGGRCHSSPMPEQSSNRLIRAGSFTPPPAGPVTLTITTLGEDITIRGAGTEVFACKDPDPAGGKFAFGSTGTMRVRNIQQWELISPREQNRRRACCRAMAGFCEEIDTHYEKDVRRCNQVEAWRGGLLWTWPATGATALFLCEGPRVRATLRAGLYGNDILLDGALPRLVVESAGGEELRADTERQAVITGDRLCLRFTLPLRSPGGTKATAHVLARLTVQTVWFWSVSVDGVTPKRIQAFLAPDPFGDSRSAGQSSCLRHNARSGLFVKAIEPETTDLKDGSEICLSTSGPRLRFATVILPAQPLNLIGFKHRMVHFIRYPEGPVQHWRRKPSPQEYPTNVDLARYAGNGADAMVWHHTWLSSDFRDREGFLVNHEEMQRAMRETHRLGMKTIGYLGIVPGRSSILRFEDLCPLGGANTYGGYTKNWDLQDQTFYHVAGRYPEFLVWMTDYWCREYGLDGFYLDGGCFGLLSRGPTREPLHPADEDLSLDELQHRTYWRVKKVLELNGAGYGLEPWSGLNWMLNGFYDCMMIGESFQEAPPDYYRNGHNALLTGCMIKMYGMRASSQNPYNIAMAAVNLGDIQVCSGNGAWGNDPDTTETWDRVRPLWYLLDSIDWDHLIEARPWYAQTVVAGDGFYAANYTEPERILLLLANRTERPDSFTLRIDRNRLPRTGASWHMRYCLGQTGDIGPLSNGTVTVRLPALHDGPVGIELRARASVRRGVEPRNGFGPSVAGKKLLAFRGPIEGVDRVAFDGAITGGSLPFFKKLDPAKLQAWAKQTAAKEFGRHTDNFYLCYSFPGKTAEDFDWFDDCSWIVENWRLMARAATTARFKGICFDSEYYEGLPLFGYAKARHRATTSLDEYAAQLRRRGAEIMRVVSEEFPDITILILYGFSGTHAGVPQHPASSKRKYALVAPFVDGLLSACGPAARIFDMHEQSFSFRVPGSFARARTMMTDLMAEQSHDPDRYRRNHRVGFSYWADCWCNATQGRPLDVHNVDNNYYTPAEMAYSIHQALAYSDGYVWMWPGAFDWWAPSGKAPPKEYLEALRLAHHPSVAAPPRSRKPNTYRVLSARTQEGWSDTATFADLTTAYKFLADLPERWRFQPDPDEVGTDRGWHRPGFDDRRWPLIRIREFWEVQGYSPYDGAAWYRLTYTPPPIPPDRTIYLAFGAVSDEATVWVNGALRYRSPFGENIRHKRFLVDVTDHLRSARENSIAVRVWNTGWCGGIWKNVKLMAQR